MNSDCFESLLTLEQPSSPMISQHLFKKPRIGKLPTRRKSTTDILRGEVPRHGLVDIGIEIDRWKLYRSNLNVDDVVFAGILLDGFDHDGRSDEVLDRKPDVGLPCIPESDVILTPPKSEGRVRLTSRIRLKSLKASSLLRRSRSATAVFSPSTRPLKKPKLVDVEQSTGQDVGCEEESKRVDERRSSNPSVVSDDRRLDNDPVVKLVDVLKAERKEDLWTVADDDFDGLGDDSSNDVDVTGRPDDQASHHVAKSSKETASHERRNNVEPSDSSDGLAYDDEKRDPTYWPGLRLSRCQDSGNVQNEDDEVPGLEEGATETCAKNIPSPWRLLRKKTMTRALRKAIVKKTAIDPLVVPKSPEVKPNLVDGVVVKRKAGRPRIKPKREPKEKRETSTEPKPKEKKTITFRSNSNVCYLCGQFSDKLAHHMQAYHPESSENKTMIPCTWKGCKRKFFNNGGLGRHLKTHELSRRTCPYAECGRVFNVRKNLTSHVSTVHESHLLPVRTCQFCAKQYKTLHKLNRHVYENHGDDTRIPCPEPGCNNVFKRKNQMWQHFLLHRNVKMYRCRWCDFSGAQQNNIRSHAYFNHRDSYEEAMRLRERYWVRNVPVDKTTDDREVITWCRSTFESHHKAADAVMITADDIRERCADISDELNAPAHSPVSSPNAASITASTDHPASFT